MRHMGNRVASISIPGATKPALAAASANASREIDEQDIAKRKTFLELGAGGSERLGSLHALIEPAKNAFTEAFYTHILSFEPMRRLMPDDQSLAQLREAQSAYFSRLMYDPEEASTLLGELNRLGFHLAVDDLGTGYSSLAYLKRFPLHALKIDRSFVQDIESNSDSAAIAAAVISLAHNLDLKVVVEGVETVNQMEYLRGLKCDIAQGYPHASPCRPTSCWPC